MNWFSNLFKNKNENTWQHYSTSNLTTWEHFCVPNSIHDAWTYAVKTKRPVRIAVTKIRKTEKIDEDHAQAQGQRANGEWVFLTTHNSDGLLREWPSHYPDLTPYRYVGLEEWIAENIGFTNPLRS